MGVLDVTKYVRLLLSNQRKYDTRNGELPYFLKSEKNGKDQIGTYYFLIRKIEIFLNTITYNCITNEIYGEK